MRRKMSCVCALFLVAAFLSSFSAHAQPANPQQTLTQYIADIQKNPNDYALREKIIRHVQTMEPKPIVSEEARKYFDRGMAAAEDAKNDKDYKDAADEFQKAVNIAPWLGAGYRGLAVTQDKCGQYSAALQNLKFFLLTNPSAEDAEKAKTLRNKIEYRMEKAAKESSPAAIAGKKQQTYEEWLGSLNGARFFGKSNHLNDIHWDNEFIINGNILSWRQRVTYYGPGVVREVPIGQWYDMAQYGGRMQIVGREAKRMGPFGSPIDIFTISEDGKTITHVVTSVNWKFTYYRQ